MKFFETVWRYLNMIRAVVVALFVLLLSSFDGGEKYLQANALYQRDSYYRTKVYDEQDWKSFFKLKEANAVIDPAHYDLHLLNAAVFYSTNKLRSEKGLGPLKFSPELRDAAIVHTQQMVEKGFLNHFNPKNEQLRAPDARMKMFGITQAKELGENIDMTEFYKPKQTTYIELAEIIVKELYDSPPHRKAMLSKTFTYIGCGAMFEKADKRNGINPVKTTQDFAAKN